MHIKKPGGFIHTQLWVRNQNLKASLKSRMNLDQVILIAPAYAAPSMVTLMHSNEITVLVDNRRLQYDACMRPANLDEMLNNSALAVMDKKDFYSRDTMRSAHIFPFLYDVRSKFFMISDVKNEMSYDAISGGFSILQVFKGFDINRNNMISGIFCTDDNGEIKTAHAKLHNYMPGDNRPMKHMFNALSRGLIRLGCPKGTLLHDATPKEDPRLIRLKMKHTDNPGNILEMSALY